MRKGFTLVELLAVIVILAFIALITIPIILNVVEKSKQKTYQRSVESYGGAVNKAISEYLIDHENRTSKILTYTDIQNYIKYEGNKVECTVNIYSDKTIYLENCKVNNELVSYTYGVKQDSNMSESVNNNENNNNNTDTQNLTNTTDNYIGYYADVDGDGNVDGVIYADLAHSKSGNWYNKATNSGQGFGTYSYEARSNLKKYIISEENSEVTTFGTNKIITLKPGSSGNSRFYVMALSDFREGSKSDGTYYWYGLAWGKMPDPVKDTSVNFGAGYDNTGTMIRIWNKNGEGEGSYIGAIQRDQDIWKHIQGKYQKGWYIPSRDEWAAFADYLANRAYNPLTNNCPTIYSCNVNGNYDDIYGLSEEYLSSSQNITQEVWYIYFRGGYIASNHVFDYRYARLSITF